jgi:hypothetical protein
MPVVDEHASDARKPQRRTKWLLVTISVLVVLLITLVLVPMVWPVSIGVGKDRYIVHSGWMLFPSPAPQGFSCWSGGPLDAWQLRLGSFTYIALRQKGVRSYHPPTAKVTHIGPVPR